MNTDDKSIGRGGQEMAGGSDVIEGRGEWMERGRDRGKEGRRGDEEGGETAIKGCFQIM